MQATHSILSRLRAGTALAALATLAATGAVLAAGSHAGGHEHGHGDMQATAETAIGKPGDAARVSRTVRVVMSDDMRFTPASIRVRQGQTLRLRVKNAGQVKHELSLGTEKELQQHLEEMKKAPEMEHEEPGKVTLQPGQQGEIVWQFTQPGVVNFACLIPGHYEAGMKGVVRVARVARK